MEIIRFNLANMPKGIPGLTLCLGNFDGVHLGHQQLIKEAVAFGKEKTGILLFETLPSRILFNKDSPYLSSPEEKMSVLEKLGVSFVFLIETDKAFFSLPKEEFLSKVVKPLGAQAIFCGQDYTFGKNRLGKVEDLQGLFDVYVVPFLTMNGAKISSSTIREEILQGDFEKAKEELGRPFAVKGTVVRGNQNGTKIGFPTANLSFDHPYPLPPRGVYAGMAYFNNKEYRAIANLGTHPTIQENKEELLEVHLLDFPYQELYGEEICFAFQRFLRTEKQFASLDELAKAIEEDKRSILAENR